MRTLIISDLHLGNGGPYDSFAGGEALPALIDQATKSGARIFVNGDGVDFLMNEEALELDVERAVGQARSIIAYPSSAAVFASMGRALAAGSEVVFRLGNHDVELALPEVQAVLRGALGQPPAVAAKLAFQLGDEPAIFDVGGARVLVTHGEHNDTWNRIDDWKSLLAKSKKFKFAPGSELVKKLLNPLTHDYKLKFANLLKPDFQGAALTALAVDPRAMKVILKKATASILWQLFRKKPGAADNFDEEAETNLGLAKGVKEAGLSEEEQAAMEEYLVGEGVGSFADDDEEGPFGKARLKMAKAGLGLYAKLQRKVTGTQGDTFFALDPSPEEWTEAQRLAKKHNVRAVIIGHTHAARWGQKDGLVFANTGTWIWLMQLPAHNAGDAAWMDFLAELKKNPSLDPAKQKVARTISRFTAVELDEAPAGGAKISLVEWVPGEGLRSLGSAVVAKSS